MCNERIINYINAQAFAQKMKTTKRNRKVFLTKKGEQE